jgi:hypothetical protein
MIEKAKNFIDTTKLFNNCKFNLKTKRSVNYIYNKNFYNNKITFNSISKNFEIKSHVIKLIEPNLLENLKRVAYFKLRNNHF